ncbi:N-6 DNA methylase [Patescibacteria group bacterium]
MLKNNKNKYGQYFTPVDVVDFMINISDVKKNGEILEPCCGKGIFLERQRSIYGWFQKERR